MIVAIYMFWLLKLSNFSETAVIVNVNCSFIRCCDLEFSGR